MDQIYRDKIVYIILVYKMGTAVSYTTGIQHNSAIMIILNFRGLTAFDEKVYNESVKLALQEEDPENEKERKVCSY